MKKEREDKSSRMLLQNLTDELDKWLKPAITSKEETINTILLEEVVESSGIFCPMILQTLFGSPSPDPNVLPWVTPLPIQREQWLQKSCIKLYSLLALLI